MAKLQRIESQYFASRHIGRDKSRVLQGWKTHFTDKVQEMHKIAVTYYERTLDQSIQSYDQKTVAATRFCVYAATILRDMNNARQWKQKPPRDFYDSGRENITDEVGDIQAVKDLAIGLDEINLHVINFCFQHTENILKLANLVSDNSPEVPYHLL
ncbi:unnamed protein product [Ectocarpus sp. 8 AP-2014]